MSEPEINPTSPQPPPSAGEQSPQVVEPVPAPAPVVDTTPGQIPASEIQNKKLVSGLLGILVGGLGIHKFYLGYQQEGLIMLLVTVLGGGFGTFLTCGLLAPVLFVMPTIGLIEGVLYLTKSDKEFADTYLTGRKTWF